MGGGNWKVLKLFFRFPHVDFRRPPRRRKNLPYPSSDTLFPPLAPSRPPKICRSRNLRCAQLCGCVCVCVESQAMSTSVCLTITACMHVCGNKLSRPRVWGGVLLPGLFPRLLQETKMEHLLDYFFFAAGIPEEPRLVCQLLMTLLMQLFKILTFKIRLFHPSYLH